MKAQKTLVAEIVHASREWAESDAGPDEHRAWLREIFKVLDAIPPTPRQMGMNPRALGINPRRRRE